MPKSPLAPRSSPVRQNPSNNSQSSGTITESSTTINDQKTLEIKSNDTERKTCDTFLKYFMYKAVELIVQSRSGVKCCSPCDPRPVGRDWV